MLSRELFEPYERALSTNAELASRAVEELVRRYDAYPMNLLEFQLRAYLPDLIASYGEQAAQAAVELYRAAREAAAPADDYEPTVGASVPARIVVQDVAETVAMHRTDGDREAVANRLAGKAVKHAMWAAESTLVSNARRDPARPRWAIVPHPGACAWCVLLGSNGFMYASQRTADSARHDSCKCCPVVDFDHDNPRLDGYDPDAMQDAYRKCYDAVRDEIDRRWASMPAAERARYTRDGRVSKDAFRRNMIVAEMSRRDREWLRTGKVPVVDYSEKSRDAYGRLRKSGSYDRASFTWTGNEWKDLFVHDTLSTNGFSVVTHKPLQEGGTTNIDIDLNGFRCEVKSPEAVPNPDSKDELKFVQRNVQSARHQFRDDGSSQKRIVFSNYYTGFVGESEQRVYERFCTEVEIQGFVEALFITKDGNVLRAK